MFSQTVEYALRAVVCLAAHGLPLTVAEIAGRMRVPPGYLAKVMQALARAGVIDSRRGKSGGFALGRPPEEITALEVVSAIEPIRRITACPLELPEHSRELCPLHRRLDDAAAAVERSLRASRISELVGDMAQATEPGGPPATARPLPVVRQDAGRATGRRAKGRPPARRPRS